MVRTSFQIDLRAREWRYTSGRSANTTPAARRRRAAQRGTTPGSGAGPFYGIWTGETDAAYYR
jgi:hypothetical protein